MVDQPSVAIVIVSYNCRAELDACLQSIATNEPAFVSRICVVDNGSSDGTPELVRERWPVVQLIEPGANLGFSRGNNAGIRATRASWCCCSIPTRWCRRARLDAGRAAGR